MRAAHALAFVLIVALALLLGALAQRFSLRADWTYGNRNTLTAASKRVLAALDAGPIALTAYIQPGPRRAKIRNRLRRYKRAAANVTLAFADPGRHPAEVRALGIGDDGAVQIRYQGRSQTVSAYDEATITNALQKLSVARDRWVVFISGHGERSVADKSRGGYSELAAALDRQGLATRTLNLAAAAAVPDNTAVAVIASPQKSLLPGEVRMLRAYVERGGAVLWADDPGPRYGLAALGRDLGIRWRNGTLIYPDYKKLGTGSPAIALLANYPRTPITARLKRLTLFAFAGGLAARAHSGWQHSVFLRSSARSWLDTGPLEKQGRVTFEPDAGDRAGPIAMGIALVRGRAGGADGDSGRRQQRAAVIADSDFMANGHFDMLGNRALALAVFQWLAHRDAQIAVDVAKAPDASLALTPAAIRTLWWIFVVALPALLVGLGLGRWGWRRRR